MRVELRPGCTVVYEGEQLQVEALDGPLVRLRRTQAERSAMVVGMANLVATPGFRVGDLAPEEARERAPDLGVELLAPEHRRVAEERLAHLLEARTG